MTTEDPDGPAAEDIARAHLQALREARGRRLREVWVSWAARQPGAKPSWLIPWEYLDPAQQEVDMQMADAIAAGERARMVELIDALTARQNQEWDLMPDDQRPQWVAREWWTAGRDEAAELIDGDSDLDAQ